MDGTLRLVVAQRLVKRKGGGRIGIFEMWRLGEDAKPATMREDAMRKVEEGVTTLAEVERVLGE